MNLLCKIFGHKPVDVYCQRERMSQKRKKGGYRGSFKKPHGTILVWGYYQICSRCKQKLRPFHKFNRID